MLGPIFNREAAIAPKRPKTYLGRGIYVLTLFLLLCTGYLVLDGSRSLATTGDSSRFSGWMFTLLAPLQLLVLSSLAAVGAASSVAQEKDRRTLILLLMTRLSGFEVVVGKLTAVLLAPLAMLLCGLPLFFSFPLLGGVSPWQVLLVFVVTAATILLAGSVGTVMGMWREKTFQAIALTVLALLMYIGIGEVVAQSATGLTEIAALATSPPRALLAAASPLASLSEQTARGVMMFVVVTLLATFGVLTIGIAAGSPLEPFTGDSFHVGWWRSIATVHWKTDAGQLASSCTARRLEQPDIVARNPHLGLWTQGGCDPGRIRSHLSADHRSAVLADSNRCRVRAGARIGRALPSATLPLAALGVTSLVLLNALAVNSVTGERDSLTLDLLLVTDLSPTEFVFGKLLGVLYVGKEMILLPIVLMIYLAVAGVITTENICYAILGGLLLFVFVTMLGIHAGLSYAVSRTATLVSLGTIFFLCVGIAICMTIMVSFRGAFHCNGLRSW